MRVLQVNKFFWVKGGSERYFFDVSEALADAGHEVASFAMHHPRNRPSPWSEHFVDEIDFHGGGSPVDQVRKATRFVSSGEAARKIQSLIDVFKPDVAHLHNVAHQLTPSILGPLSRAGVPVVQTLHDYKLICSSYLLFSGGAVCERCRGGNHAHALEQRCHHGSLAKSALGFAEMSWHAARGSYRRVGRFLCPSRFMRSKCAEFGVDEDRLVHFPYFLFASRYRPQSRPGDYALYVGRLSREKGVGTLLEAATRLRSHRLVVLGEGPAREELEGIVRERELPVEFAGYRSGDALHDTIRDAAFVVVPSEWYENLPYAVLESFALGKPVLGARMGGIPELVVDGETGYGFDSGDVDSLVAGWERMLEDRGRLEEMGQRARSRIEQSFDAPAHVDTLLDLYRGVAA